MKALHLVPLLLDEANAFVASFHRHNDPVPGARWAVGASDGAVLVAVAIVGRPTAWPLQDGFTAEVKRVCTDGKTRTTIDRAGKEHTLGVCSLLYAACWRAWRAMGGRRLVTYNLTSESGASLRGAGAKLIAELPPRDPASWQSRAGRDWQPVVGQSKFRLEWNHDGA